MHLLYKSSLITSASVIAFLCAYYHKDLRTQNYKHRLLFSLLYGCGGAVFADVLSILLSEKNDSETT